MPEARNNILDRKKEKIAIEKTKTYIISIQGWPPHFIEVKGSAILQFADKYPNTKVYVYQEKEEFWK